ncbi:MULTISPECIES: metallophosphoesterase [Streptococcus]|uniref:Metallophosphoesterase n=1 Tax=Streptococcus caledonicus TaxID=2614158 RepID=A0ABW0UAT6_9STRE|nr:metallophosphoesterase [Streptococcus sp. S784/96/1]
MKKCFIRFTLILLSMIVSYLIISQFKPQAVKNAPTSSEAPVSIVVATDLHYLSPSLHDDGSFFTDMVDNADGKNMYFIEEITEAFVDKMVADKPEFLIISGDLTFNGEKQSHIDLEKKLARIKNAGVTVLVMPGNHDIDRSSAAKFKGENYELVDSISKEEFAKIYKNYGLQESLHRDDKSLSYVYSARGDLWFLFVDSNSNADNKLSSDTLKWIESMLKEAEKNKIKVIGISHQNLLPHNPDFSSGFLIDQSPKLSALYQNSQVFLNLSGHIHIQHISEGQPTEIITSSLAVSPHQYGKIAVDAKNLDYQVEQVNVENWAKSNDINNEKLLHFSEYSRIFMEELAKRKSKEWTSDSELPQEKITLVRDTFASLNADYFAGKSSNLEEYSEGINLIENQFDGFIISYLKNIIADSKKNHQELSLPID